jgi:hypothetical protein
LKFENLGGALQYAYPEIYWEGDKFSFRRKKSEQRWLKALIEDLLPGIEIMEDYQHPDLIWGVSISVLIVLFHFSRKIQSPN